MNSIPTLPPICSYGKRPPGAKTVLIVDDFAPLGELIASHLSSCGYHVLVAHNAAEARDVAAGEEQIDLLLTDVNMPGLRGDELAACFAVERPGIPIVLMANEPISLAAVAGWGVLQKPFALAEVQVAVQRALAWRFGNSSQEHERNMAA